MGSGGIGGIVSPKSPGRLQPKTEYGTFTGSDRSITIRAIALLFVYESAFCVSIFGHKISTIFPVQFC
ncbi:MULTISPECIES: hypothetical protein [Cyanophyceae]|uniref:hypothetical protein n=1 Tax=Cyanophyceae TaxID=3028117 RepID=UPI0016826C22|nr:hypothetical protein [Trichocoleus sp. FACHB-40]MBD2003200.1 hypothetical protein [Trichocoleus sp. FACHB-40]